MSTRQAIAVTGDAPAAKPELPPGALVVLGAVALAAVTVQSTIFEHSLVEGLIRASLEGAGLLAAVVVLGRLLGLRR
jgi:hypothetical protein